MFYFKDDQAAIADLLAHEPQHPKDKLRTFSEHNQDWIECLQCGRQFAYYGNDCEIVTEGDGYCDEHPAEG